jgi:glycosyltransferase involved in cell wall biosynthesis
MDFPKISIITPTYNSESKIEACLQSVINQSYSNIEHLIIDNLSTDKTIDIVLRYKELYPLSIRWVSEKDRGIYDAMNKGIKLAKGDWLYFLGSDDKFYNENVLSTIFNDKQTKHPQIIYGNVIINGDAGWAKNGQIYDGEFTLSKLIDKNICHQAIFFNKIVFKRVGRFNLKYNICADWDMNFRLWATYPFTYTETIIAVFNGGNSSSKIENNYTETDKWESIVRSFKYKVISRKFSKYSRNFLALSCYYKEKHKYLKSCFLKIVFYVHNYKN